jgi:hypothetical protein
LAALEQAAVFFFRSPHLAKAFLPACPNLKAITLDYNKSKFKDISTAEVIAELERIHGLAESCHISQPLAVR